MRRWLWRGLALLVLVPLLALGALRGAAALRETEAQEPVPAEGHLVATGMGRIYVEEAGPADGVPVLLVHGSVGWAGLWRETSAALAARGYRAIAFDMPPMGWSDRDPEHGYDRATQARRIVALVEALDIQPVLVAHSFGAGAAAEAALTAPDAFAALIVVDGAIGLGQGGTGGLPLALRPQLVRQLAVSATATNPLAVGPLLKLFLYRKETGAAYQDLIWQPYRRQGATSAMADWLPTLLQTPALASADPAAWAGLAMPLVLLWGAEDTATPLAQGQALAAAVPGAVLDVLPGIGHIPQIEDPALFQSRLLAALDMATPRH